MHIAVVTFDGCNEIDSFVASHMLNRMRDQGWQAHITAPAAMVTSMNGVVIHAQQPLEFTHEADVVLIGSGRRTREMIEDATLMSRLTLDPSRQLIGSQCSGALVLARLGLLANRPVCADGGTRVSLEQAGYEVLDQPLYAHGNVATAGGCLSAQYLACWVLWRLGGRAAVERVLDYVAPAGERGELTARVFSNIGALSTARDEAQHV